MDSLTMKRAIVIVILAILILNSFGEFLTASTDEEDIPLFDNFNVPTISPGEQGELSFSLTNRYASAMENVTFKLEIYKYSLEGVLKNISEINNPPVIKESNTISIIFSYVTPINSTAQVYPKCTILAFNSTPRATYCVRLWLEFDYNASHYKMYSVGYFSEEDWAIFDITGELPEGCDGIIPETSFTVKFVPIAIISASPVVVEIGQPITFDASASYDLDGNVTGYYFDFGDGSNTGWINETIKSHLYTTSGIYYPALRVKDDNGTASDFSYIKIIVGLPSQSVSPSGGVVKYINIVIEVPEGAITQNVTFTVTKITLEQPSGYILIGDVCRIETNITIFTQSITLILSYNESDLPTNVSEDGLAIYKKVGNDWIKLDSTVDKVNNTVSTLTTSFSEFAILYKLPGAEIEPTGIQPLIHIYLIIAVIITMLIIIAAIMKRKRKTAVAEVEKPEAELSFARIPMLTFRCPKCQTTFQVESKEKPFKVKCPNCGTEGAIR